MSAGTPADRVVYTVGHSNHTVEMLLDLLRATRIAALVDTRSVPVSRFAPHFDREPLKAAVEGVGIRYVFMGQSLGGRPAGAGFYDTEGHVRYDRVAESASFLAGIQKLEIAADQAKTVILCSEEDPSTCHRHLLVGRVLGQRGARLLHIRADGRVQTDEDLALEVAAKRGEAGQQSLFEEDEVREWRSLRSVSRRAPPSTSSGG